MFFLSKVDFNLIVFVYALMFADFYIVLSTIYVNNGLLYIFFLQKVLLFSNMGLKIKGISIKINFEYFLYISNLFYGTFFYYLSFVSKVIYQLMISIFKFCIQYKMHYFVYFFIFYKFFFITKVNIMLPFVLAFYFQIFAVFFLCFFCLVGYFTYNKKKVSCMLPQGIEVYLLLKPFFYIVEGYFRVVIFFLWMLFPICNFFINFGIRYYNNLYQSYISRITLMLSIFVYSMLCMLGETCRYHVIFNSFSLPILGLGLLLYIFLLLLLKKYKNITFFFKIQIFCVQLFSFLCILLVFILEKSTKVSIFFYSKFFYIEKVVWEEPQKMEIALELVNRLGMTNMVNKEIILASLMSLKNPEEIQEALVEIKRQMDNSWTFFFQDWCGYFLRLDRPATTVEVVLFSLLVLAVACLCVIVIKDLSAPVTAATGATPSTMPNIPIDTSNVRLRNLLVENTDATISLSNLFVYTDIVRYFRLHKKHIAPEKLRARKNQFETETFENKIKYLKTNIDAFVTYYAQLVEKLIS